MKFLGLKMRMLIKKGAEASLYLEKWHDRMVILKKRLSKRYRVPELDRDIQLQRTKHEPQIMHRAKKAGVSTPMIFMVDLAEAAIIMEFVEGKQVKKILNDLPEEERIRLCRKIGTLIGRLHSSGIVHGDLTTSNLILTPQGKIVFVDFGLSELTSELEARGVDLHLMKRALNSTHYRHAAECFGAILSGYRETVGKNASTAVLDKIMEIEKRGRYISER